MITTTIITLNEEKNIRKAITSVKELSSEIIVVDCGSSDKTEEIAKKLGARVFFRKFDNFSNQKNWAVSKANEEWILATDADEEIPKALEEEIKEAVKNERYAGFLIPRRNFILGGEIKHTRWSPDKHIWLWKKDLGKWVGNVHEEVVVKGEIGLLKNAKIHYSHKNVEEFIRTNERYSSLEADNLFKKNFKFIFWKMFWHPIFEFFLRYILKMGFLDGRRGFMLSYLMGIYKLTVWIKLWELKKQKI